jgi:hypothetical protein
MLVARAVSISTWAVQRHMLCSGRHSNHSVVLVLCLCQQQRSS